MYTRPERHDKIDVKGIQFVRRDSCPLVKDVSGAILDAVMYTKDVDAALKAAKAHVIRLLEGRYSIDKFVVSKALRSDYKNAVQVRPARGHAFPDKSRTTGLNGP